ncbi:hypothetical protein D3C72_2355610 [compost metagenome]
MQRTGQIEARLLAIEGRAQLAQGMGDRAGSEAHALLVGVTACPGRASVTTAELGPLEQGQQEQRDQEETEQGDGNHGGREHGLTAVER